MPWTTPSCWRTERDLYTIYCKYTLRNGVTATTGTTSAVLTAGASMLITAPLLTSRAIYLRTISQELAACSKLVQQRGLTSLPTPYWQIATTGALTVALGAVSLVVQVPGIDGVVDWLLPDAIEHALEHAIEDVADAVAEEVVEHVVETATGRAVVRGVEMVATETITWLQHSALAEALHAAFHVDVVAVLEPQLELWTTLLHDNAALQAKLAEHIVKQIHVRVEAGLLAILSLGLGLCRASRLGYLSGYATQHHRPSRSTPSHARVCICSPLQNSRNRAAFSPGSPGGASSCRPMWRTTLAR
ncbi:hypothetical protein PINS_up012489 [Pythium insidiosum]|nr:hypothetical protein PINS_up012489 [Pythium insidiosum]